LAVCTPETAAIGRKRGGVAMAIEERQYGETFDLAPGAKAVLHPAGHVLGSAMLLVERDVGSLVYTGDYKLRQSLTVPAAEPPRADVLVMESTYGSPYFRFPPAEETAARLIELVEAAFAEGKQPVAHGYSLGKSQEIVRILTAAGINVTLQGAVHRMTQIYRDLGVELGRDDQIRKYDRVDFSGDKQLDLRERGVFVCPPRDARTSVTGQFGDDVCRIMMSGWALSKDAKYRYGVEHVLPLSDHADWDELVETIELVRPKHVVAHHGFANFPDHLHKQGLPRRLGFEVRLAKPPQQMTLF
jgi:Cft2 family RNA processing exonuclease